MFGPGPLSVLEYVPYPAPADVREGVTTGDQEGTLVLPVETDVRDGITYGADEGEYEGNLTLPTEEQVLNGVEYGAEGEEFEGSLIPPITPGVTLVNSGTGTSVIATITGAVNAVHTLYWKQGGGTGWEKGVSRIGPGVLQQGGLHSGLYLFIVIAEVDGIVSYPSAAVRFLVFAQDEDATPAMVVRELLVTAEYFTLPSEKEDWPLFVTFLPDGDEVPTDCGAVYDTTGVRDARILDTGENLFRFGFQVRLRGSDYTALWKRAEAVSDFLASVQNVDVQMGAKWWTVQDVSITTPPISLGLEPGVKKRRHLFTVNGIVALSRKE